MPQTTESACGIQLPRPKAAEYLWRAAAVSQASFFESMKLTDVLLDILPAASRSQVSIWLRAATIQLSRSQTEWQDPTSEKGV